MQQQQKLLLMKFMNSSLRFCHFSRITRGSNKFPTFLNPSNPRCFSSPARYLLQKLSSNPTISETIQSSDDASPNSRVLPEELMRNVIRLSCKTSGGGGNCDVYVVGTNHVSLKSCQEVKAVINFLKPQAVFLELCDTRKDALNPHELKVPTVREMIQHWLKNENALMIVYSWYLLKIGCELEVFPGSEFRVAYEEARKYGGKFILGDRPVNITVHRLLGKMPLWHKTKLLYYLVFQPPEKLLMPMDMDDRDMLALLMQEMSNEFPTLMETLIHERDMYMSSRLLKVASEHNSVVAVVGKGHLEGIRKYWKQPVEMDKLLDMPSKVPTVSVAMKILRIVGITLAGVAIFYIRIRL